MTHIFKKTLLSMVSAFIFYISPATLQQIESCRDYWLCESHLSTVVVGAWISISFLFQIFYHSNVVP